MNSITLFIIGLTFSNYIVSIHTSNDRLPRQDDDVSDDGNDDDDDDIETRIVNGHQVGSGESIKYHLYYTYKGFYECGATLVEVYAIQIAITANHCLWIGFPSAQTIGDPKDYKLVAGDRVFQVQDQEQYSKVKKIVSYPDYDPNFYTHDIAIMFLETPFKENKWIAPIGLPSPDWEQPDNVKVAGWGSKKFGGALQMVLTWADIPVVPDTICEKFNHRSNIPHDIDTRFQFCAGRYKGAKQMGSCSGDSGGGAIAWNDTLNEGYLAGIISFGTSNVCTNPKYPGVYTRMTYYVDWIRIEVAKYREENNLK